MNIGKFLVAAATVATLSAAGASAASAQPWDHRGDRDHRGAYGRHEVHRPYVRHDRMIEVLRTHRYRVLGDPYFVRGHYVVRTHDRRGRIAFVEIDPYSGAFIGEFRL